MKLVRKRDIFTHFDAYLDDKMSIGDCIDECETLDLSEVIIELEKVRDRLIELRDKPKPEDLSEDIQALYFLIDELKQWGWD